jgi:hypothetical protein
MQTQFYTIIAIFEVSALHAVLFLESCFQACNTGIFVVFHSGQ